MMALAWSMWNGGVDISAEQGVDGGRKTNYRSRTGRGCLQMLEPNRPVDTQISTPSIQDFVRMQTG